MWDYTGIINPPHLKQLTTGRRVNYSTLNDETLIRLVARAHADALGELYDRYSRLVFSLALNLVGDHATAEEITLDVFTRVWEKAETYRSEQAKVGTWLTSIARYRSIDILRRRSSRPERHSVDWVEVSAYSMPSFNSPEQATELALRQERVRAAVASLPPEQKEALALAYFQGYTHRQVAEALDLPLGTVKTRIRLAMQKLRDLLLEE
jgi:RNA polymerase sigma-70 factor (ECF subfamily)